MAQTVARPTPEERSRKIAEDLWRQREAVMNSPELQAQIRASHEAKVRAFEEKYGIRSEDIHPSIERGDLIETQEVGTWIFEYELLQRSQEG